MTCKRSDFLCQLAVFGNVNLKIKFHFCTHFFNSLSASYFSPHAFVLAIFSSCFDTQIKSDFNIKFRFPRLGTKCAFAICKASISRPIRFLETSGENVEFCIFACSLSNVCKSYFYRVQKYSRNSINVIRAWKLDFAKFDSVFFKFSSRTSRKDVCLQVSRLKITLPNDIRNIAPFLTAC